ncbi:MAG: hypothetical protein KatS3mg115_2322 [Candidatus Poribacteria bacterium]|nr:MAG: hypothetical protein KatS3mg115_2322 [Candidatus Poribacteria bacterium]
MRGVLLTAFFSGLAFVGWAQGEVDLSQPLTLEDCIRIGLENATELRVAELNLRSRELDLDDARASFLPTLRTNARWFGNDRVSFGLEEENVDWSVQASYLLWDQGRRRISLRQTESNLEAARAALQRQRAELILAIVRAYYRVLEARALVELDQQILEVSRGTVERVRGLLEVEEAIPTDVAAAEVRVANDELALLADQNALETALAQLPVVLGLDPSIRLQVAEDVEFQSYAQTGAYRRETRTLEEAIQQALEQREEVRESELNLRVLELSQRLAKLEQFPQVTVQGSYSVVLDDYLRERGDFSRFRSWEASVNLSFPIFDGGVTRRTLLRSDVQLERARVQHEALKRQIALEVTQAYLNLMQAQKRLDISTAQVRSAELNLQGTQERYQLELAILLELLDAQTQYAQATTTQVRTYYTYKTAEAEFKRAIGEELP